MIEEIVGKAFITKVTSALFDAIFGRKDKKEDNNHEMISDEKIKFLIEQKLTDEIKDLSKNKNITFLDDIRNSFIQRIHNIFTIFDIKAEEIPIFLKQFKITNKDVMYEENILEKFDDQVIDYIAKTLKIDKNWIYGRTKQMIPIEQGCYKNSINFCKNILDSNPSQIYIITDGTPNKDLDKKNETNRITIVIQYSNTLINNRVINTYKVYGDSCVYGYWRCRYELKKFLICIKKAHSINKVNGKSILNSYDEIYKVTEGKTTFNDLLRNSIMWYADDYIDLPENNTCAKIDELEELKTILDEYDKNTHY